MKITMEESLTVDKILEAAKKINLPKRNLYNSADMQKSVCDNKILVSNDYGFAVTSTDMTMVIGDLRNERS